MATTTTLCFGNNNSTGTATATPYFGVPPYYYLWSNGQTTQTATGLATGNYTCTITDAANNIFTQAFTIYSPPPIVLTTVVNVPTACSSATGLATVNVSGGTPGYTYSWSPYGGSNTTATGLSAGTYVFTVTDSNNCVNSLLVSIAQTVPPVATVQGTTPATCGQQNGNISVSATGGMPGYTYSWSPYGGNSSTALNLGGGTYTCVVTDANGCADTVVATLSQTSAFTLLISATNVNCFGSNTRTSTVTESV